MFTNVSSRPRVLPLHAAVRHLFACAALPLTMGIAMSAHAQSDAPANGAADSTTLPAVKVQGQADTLRTHFRACETRVATRYNSRESVG